MLWCNWLKGDIQINKVGLLLWTFSEKNLIVSSIKTFVSFTTFKGLLNFKVFKSFGLHTTAHTLSIIKSRFTNMQGAGVKRRPSRPVEGVVPGSGAFSGSLFLGGDLGLLCLDALWTVQHHLNYSILHQWGEAKQQTSDQPDVNGFHIGHFGQLWSQGGALGRQREHGEDACMGGGGRAQVTLWVTKQEGNMYPYTCRKKLFSC